MDSAEKLDVTRSENLGQLRRFLDVRLGDALPARVEMLELLLRDGLQHATKYIPVQAKLWFADQIVRAGFKKIEVTNFSHPVLMPQTSDAEETMKQVALLDSVKENKVNLKVYAMTVPAFQRIADCMQKGYGPHEATFTISTEDLHGRRNSGRTREEYFEEIPELCKIARENGFKINMAIACVYGSAIGGLVPIENTFELIDRGLDLGIRNFTPCDTTGESNPLRSYLYMAALVDRYSKHDNEMTYRIAHFHEARGISIANTIAAIAGGARIIEASLGMLGGQPSFVVDNVPGIGSGPLYTNSAEVGNCSTEDILVALSEMGIETGIDIDRALQIGRVLEWVLGRTLPPWSTKAGRPIKQPVEWNIQEGNLAYVPPYGPLQVYWADPSRYKPASASFVAKEFEGRNLGRNPWEEKVKRVEENEKGKTAVYSHGGREFVRNPEGPPKKKWFILPKK